MPGRERVPSTPTGRREFEVPSMHELGARTPNDMFQDIGAHGDKAMCDEALPAGVLPWRLFQSIPDCQQQETQYHQRLPLAETVSDIAQLGQPGIGKVISVNIVEGTDEPGQRGIPFK